MINYILYVSLFLLNFNSNKLLILLMKSLVKFFYLFFKWFELLFLKMIQINSNLSLITYYLIQIFQLRSPFLKNKKIILCLTIFLVNIVNHFYNHLSKK